MVVTDLPAALANGVTQPRTGSPSTCTVQAPHSAMPQPNLVPVMPSSSRRTQRRGVSSGALLERTCSLILSEVMVILVRGQRVGRQGMELTG